MSDDLPPGVPPGAPRVSVVMANWQGERHLGAAIASVLAQDMGDLELLVADDASGDRSLEVAEAAAARDARVRVLPGARNEGPSAARNRALDAARGEWVAVVDSDDLLHPRRLSLLLEAAARTGADMVADDMSFFGEGPGAGGRTLLGPLALDRALPVAPETFVRSNEPGGGLPPLGYLKPLIRRDAMGSLRYDPAVRVGEDYDLYLRLMLRGLSLVLVPWPLYLYRRHAASLSHRLSVAALEPLLAAHEAVAATLADADPALRGAMAARGRGLARALRFEHLVAVLKARAPGRAAGLALRDPALLRLLAGSLRERLSRRAAGPPGGAPARVTLLSEGAAPPPGVDGAVLAPPLSLDRLDAGPALVALACRLGDLASRGPVEALAVGPDAVDAMGFLPEPSSAEAWLTAAEEDARPAPAGMRVSRLPAP